MKKFFVSGVIILVFVGYFWFQKQTLLAIDVVPGPSTTPTPSRTPNPTSVPSNNDENDDDGTQLPIATLKPTVLPTALPTTLPTIAPTPQISGFRDGTYTSQVGDAGYGPLQFKLIVQGGKIIDVQFLQYPTDARHSREVSNYSLPILKQETVIAQSANVDIVSGATATSETFIKILKPLLANIKV